MAHHKRRRPKSRRAGCLFCKGHKHQREAKIPPVAAQRRMQDDKDWE